MRRTVTAILSLTLASTAANAAEIRRLDITRDGSRFGMNLDAHLSTPLEASYRAFRNFDNLPRINDAIEAAESLDDAPAGAERLRTRVRVCVWKFCTRLEQVQDIRETRSDDGYALNAVVLPERSNLRYGTAAWQLRDCDGGTCLGFQAEVIPDFWVPPLIGPWVIERAMRREAIVTAQGIERLTQQQTTEP